MGMQTTPPRMPGQRHRAMRIAITIAAIAIAVAHVAWPSITVDAITATFLVVALLPWLAPLVKTLELPGGFKVELQELERKALDAKGAAESATMQAELAVATATRAEDVRRAAPPTAEDERRELAAEYDRIRASQPSGPRRTSAMTALLGRMIALAPRLRGFDASRALTSEDRGERLSGYAFLYANPDPGAIDALVRSVTRIEDRPFGQYWGLRALGAVLANGGELRPELRRELERFRDRIDPGTDRAYELNKLLAD